VPAASPSSSFGSRFYLPLLVFTALRLWESVHLVGGIAKQVKHFNIRHQTPFSSRYHYETDIACEFIGSSISREGDDVVSN
jgi:hypothetical protein